MSDQWRVWGCLAAVVFTTAAQAAAVEGCAYGKFKHGRAWFHCVTADLNRTQIAATAYYSPRLTSASRTLGKVQPIAAVTGTFFAFENQQPVADVVIDGKLVANGYRGSVLGVDWFGKVKIFDAAVRTPVDFFAYRYALRGMVRVLRNGEKCPDPRSQGFRDPRIWGVAARTGVGLTKSGKLVMVATSNGITLSELAQALKNRGAVDAVSLDGGGSTMLYYMGSVKVSPNRGLSTLFMVEKRSPFDAQFNDHLSRLGWNQAGGAVKGALSVPGQ